MPAIVRAASAATLILFALGAPAAAMEEKSTKPRIAVLEFANSAEPKLQVESWFWSTTAPAGQAMEMNSWLEAAQAGQMGPGRATGDPDRPVLAGRVPNPGGATSPPEAGDEVMVAMERGDSTSGQATGKRQHKPITITKEWGAATPQLMKLDRPAAKGSVWIRTSQPWAACRVGARYPSAKIDGYRLNRLVVSSCPRTSAAEGITLSYEGFHRVR